MAVYLQLCKFPQNTIKSNKYLHITLLLNSAINPCSEHSCTQLCLLSGLRPRYYTCHCQSGWKLDTDKRTCIKGMLSLLPHCTLLNICNIYSHFSVSFYLFFFHSLECIIVSCVFTHLNFFTRWVYLFNGGERVSHFWNPSWPQWPFQQCNDPCVRH